MRESGSSEGHWGFDRGRSPEAVAVRRSVVLITLLALLVGVAGAAAPAGLAAGD